MPAPERDSPRWRYWRGRALEALGRIEEAKPVYQAIAGQRDYYSFLAADRLGAPYTIASTPLTIPASSSGFPACPRSSAATS